VRSIERHVEQVGAATVGVCTVTVFGPVFSCDGWCAKSSPVTPFSAIDYETMGHKVWFGGVTAGVTGELFIHHVCVVRVPLVVLYVWCALRLLMVALWCCVIVHFRCGGDALRSLCGMLATAEACRGAQSSHPLHQGLLATTVWSERLQIGQCMHIVSSRWASRSSRYRTTCLCVPPFPDGTVSR
jgi:hypothetical protein